MHFGNGNYDFVPIRQEVGHSGNGNHENVPRRPEPGFPGRQDGRPETRKRGNMGEFVNYK